jgi:hypothetical protein
MDTQSAGENHLKEIEELALANIAKDAEVEKQKNQAQVEQKIPHSV